MSTELCDLAFKYKTDKCPEIRHSYTPYYFDLFKNIRNKVKKVFEMGIGTPTLMKHAGEGYVTGASLYMWRDFFPNAQIYGADISPEAIFQEDRIKTFMCDQSSKIDMERIIGETGGDIDIFIDDGNHYRHKQLDLARIVLPMLKSDVIYVIEDVHSVHHITSALTAEGYECSVPKLNKEGYRENLVIVKNK